MKYFNDQVMSSLLSENVVLTDREVAACTAACVRADQMAREGVSFENPLSGQTYAILHGQVTRGERRVMTHWMLLPDQKNPKVMVNLITGTKRDYKRKKQRQYLTPQVLDVLNEEGIFLTSEMIGKIRALCKEGQAQKLIHKISKKQTDLPHSIFFLPRRKFAQTLSPWLVLPTPNEWVSKDIDDNGVETVAKVLINLETADKKVVKIRRALKPGLKTHLNQSEIEETNNDLLDMEAQHLQLTSPRNNTEKAYLVMPFYGEQNLKMILKNQGIPSEDLLNFLLEGGRALQAMHAKGRLYLDFKPRNMVIDRRSKKMTLIDHEFNLSKEQGRIGIDDLRGSPDYLHPGWRAESEARLKADQKVIYTVQNDVYAFLVTAHACLSEAYRRGDASMKDLLDPLLRIVDNWKKRPFDQMPALDAVMIALTMRIIPEAKVDSRLKLVL